MYNLATMLFHGDGIQKDKQQAVSLLKKAAAKNYCPAMYNLGTLLLEGKHISQDKDSGLQWLKKASKRGSVLAKRKLESLQ